MKRIALGFLLVTAFLGCKKDSAGPTVNQESRPFIGTWIGNNSLLLKPDTLVLNGNQLCTSTLFDAIYSFEVLPNNKIKFVLKSKINNDTRSSIFDYTIDSNLLIINDWGADYQGTRFTYTFNKQ